MTNKTIYQTTFRFAEEVGMHVVDVVAGELVWGYRSYRDGMAIYVKDEITDKVLHVELMTGEHSPLHIKLRTKALKERYSRKGNK